MKLAVVIPLRNRAGMRLENCLRSLRGQKDVAADISIVLSDFGSTSPYREEIRELAARFDARVVYTDTSETWNRSRALNNALKTLAADVAFCTDADMIFQDNFVATILAELSAEPSSMVLCRCRDLPESVEERAYQTGDFAELLSRSTLRQAKGTGACQAATVDWFRRVGGYDEKYVFWGFEDKDMHYRSQADGLASRWIHEKTAMLHQWHRTTKNDRYLLKWKNKLRYFLTRGRVVKGASGRRSHGPGQLT